MVAKVEDSRVHPPVRGLAVLGRLTALWRRTFSCLVQCRLIALLLGLGALLFALGLSDLLLGRLEPERFLLFQVSCLVGGAVLLSGALWVTWRDYVEPLIYLRDWVLHMRGGNLAARIPVPAHGEFAELAQDLNSLGEMLESLSRDTEQQLQHYTEHMAQKTRSLSVLYDVAASINVSRDLDDLLTRFLHTLTEVVGARAAAVRLLTRDGQMRLVASTGLDDEMVEREKVLPAQSCLCGKAVTGGDLLFQSDMAPCSKRVGRSFFNGEELSMLVVPLQYRGRTLGVYNLYVNKDTFDQREDLKELFTSIGRHLGMAIDKARLDEETNRLSIMEERTRLAHELHDSLAQTLASVRFQIRVLDETLHQGDEATIWQELERIESSIDEANTELRELIAHFRAPLGARGLIPAIERTITRFRQECKDTHVFLQKEWPDRPLPSEHEMQVLRIVQEALANIRKHAQANTVRVMLRGDEQGNYMVLVEDDGEGLGERSRSDSPGEHVGLSIMQDRARRIGGRLRIESEPGEGVRVILTFHQPEQRDTPIDIYPREKVDGATRTGNR
jgi:two-component system nitrate/nitrite sensor histidine kinase NarX